MKRAITYTAEWLHEELKLPKTATILGAYWNAVTYSLCLVLHDDTLPDIPPGKNASCVRLPITNELHLGIPTDD